MTISYVSQGTTPTATGTGTGTTSVSPDLPGSLSTGDLVLLYVGAKETGSVTIEKPSLPSGVYLHDDFRWGTQNFGDFFGSSTLSHSTDTAWCGEGCLKIVWHTGAAGASLAAQNVSGLTINNTYTFSAWVWVPSGSPRVRVGAFFVQDGEISTLYDQWQRLSVTFTATDTTHAMILFSPDATTQDQYAYADGCLVNSGSSALSFHAAAWTGLSRVSGGGGTSGLDTGPTQTAMFCRIKDSSWSSMPTVTVTNGDSSMAQAFGYSSTLSDRWHVRSATGTDETTGTSWSASMSNNLGGIKGGDWCFAASTIPTDISTPAQFSSEAFGNTTGITWGTMTERSEPETTQGNDIGGFVFQRPASSGTTTNTPTVTATAGGTTTNVRGTSVMVKMAELSYTFAPAFSDTCTIRGWPNKLAVSTNSRFADSLSARSTRECDILVLGDSVAEGCGASTMAYRWVDRLRSRMRTDYATTGVLTTTQGYIPAYYVYVPSDAPAPTKGGGAYDEFTPQGLGGRAVGMDSVDDTLTWPQVPGTKVEVWYHRIKFFAGAFDVKVDNTTQTTLDAFTDDRDTWAARDCEGLYKWTSTTFGSGNHTVSCHFNATPHGTNEAKVLGVRWFDGDEGKGVHVLDGSKAGHTVADHLANGSSMSTLPVAYQADLIIIPLGLNDSTLRTPSEFQGDLLDLIDYCRDTRPNVPIILLGYYEPGADRLQEMLDDWSAYITAMKTAAANRTYVTMLDLSVLMPNADGNISADGLHPNDLGHELIAKYVADWIEGIHNHIDNAGITDSYSVQKTSPITRSSTDNTGVTDAFTGWTREGHIQQTCALTDTVTMSWTEGDITRSAIDLAHLTDNVTVYKTQADILFFDYEIIYDQLAWGRGFIRSSNAGLHDSYTIQENLISKSQTDNAGLTDSRTYSKAYVRQDSFSLPDTVLVETWGPADVEAVPATTTNVSCPTPTVSGGSITVQAVVALATGEAIVPIVANVIIPGLESLFINGVQARTYGYNISTKTGWYSMPELRRESVVLPGRSGSLPTSQTYNQGMGVLSVWCSAAHPYSGLMASTMTARRTQFEENFATLMGLISGRGRLAQLQSYRPDGSIRQANVEWHGGWQANIDMGGQNANWDVVYTIPDTFWEDPLTRTQGTVAGTALAQTLNLTDFSGMTGIIQDAVITVTGAITNPKITDMETGYWIQYDGSLSSGETWVIDAGNFTSTKGGSSVMSSTHHVGDYCLFSISNLYNNTDTPRLQLTGSFGDTNTKFEVEARRKWVSG